MSMTLGTDILVDCHRELHSLKRSQEVFHSSARPRRKSRSFFFEGGYTGTSILLGQVPSLMVGAVEVNCIRVQVIQYTPWVKTFVSCCELYGDGHVLEISSEHFELCLRL